MSQPVSEAVFQILLSLSDRPRHGLGIADEVEVRTEGRVTLGAGTLYTALGRLREERLIEEVEPPTDDQDSRRRVYGLSEVGRVRLAEEARRLETLVRDARGKAVLPGRSGA